MKRVLALSLDFKIPESVPKTVLMNELRQSITFSEAFLEEELKVEDLVTTELLCQYRLIANFQSIHGVNGRGQPQTPNDLKEYTTELSIIINKAAKDEDLLTAT
uniref:Uncharacterized protein n=1 Tax=Cannabis sativa TaxID=3483 RepID=A0A803P9W9_CANSA